VSRSVIVDPSDEIRILHVDDDVNQSEFLRYFLPEMDEEFSIDSVCDPCKAMEKMESERYDCVVTDYQMPKMNGIELSEKIRESFDIPIIIYTGQGSEEIAEAAFSAGIDDYLRKEMDPSHYQVLAKRIRQVVEKKRTETLYKTVVEQTRDALSIFIGGRVVFANQSTLDLLRADRLEDIIGTNPFTFGDRNKPDSHMLDTGFHEYQINTKEKEKLHIEISTSPITYNGQRAILCFARDVTEKKRLELDNEISQERFRTLVNLVPDGIMSLNPLGYATFANDAYLKLTGFSRDEIVGRHMTAMGTIRRKDLFKHIQTFASILKGHIPPPIEFHWLKKDGTPALGLAHISVIEINGKKEILMITRDITNIKKREREFENLFNNAPDGILQIDSTGAIMSINGAALKYTELDREDAIGQHFNTVFNISGGEISEFQNILNINGRNSVKAKPFELMLNNNHADPVWIEAHPSIIEIEDEKHAVQLIFRDITERKRIEEERRLYSERLEQVILGNKQINPLRLEKMNDELSSNMKKIEDYLSMIKSLDNSNLSDLQGIDESIDKINKIIANLEKDLLTYNQVRSEPSTQTLEKDAYNMKN
jgi:PAS domain S-box-containing protein